MAEAEPAGHDGRLLRVTLSVALVIAGVWLLAIGKALLIPFVLAVFVWYLVLALNALWGRIRIGGQPIPRWLATPLSTLAIFFMAYFLLSLIATNVEQMVAAAPGYQEKLAVLYADLLERFDIDETALTDQLMGRIDLAVIVGSIGTGLAGFFGNGVLIAMYVVFLLLERRYFDTKLRAIVRCDDRRATVREAAGQIAHDVKLYVGVKIFVSLITAVGAYAIMRLMALDFAEFWAVLIFVLNFIPYIGSTIASVLPTLLALAQFGSFVQALLLFGGVQVVQMTVGYLVEPAMMGKTLNISPLAVMLTLAFWGALWGVPGMFLSVPITVMVMIVCSHFESTRWVAVLLSNSGDLKSADGKEAGSV